METKKNVAPPTEFIIPKETSWHFERKLKPDDKTVDNYVLIQPGAQDVAKVLKAYTHHPISAYNIASIEIVYNEALNRQFLGNMQLMNKRKGNPNFVPKWRDTATGIEKTWREATYRKLQDFSANHSDPSLPNIMLLPLWHGTSDTVSDYIFGGGYGIFNINDPSMLTDMVAKKIVTDEGYFGKGIYATHEAEYAFRSYAQKHDDKAVLLLNWVSIYEAYPVIDGDMPKLKGKMGGFDQCDAHFIPVRSDLHPNTDIYLPCAPNEDADYHEMVVFQYQQCLPRYRVKLIQNAPQPPLDDTATLCYQSGLDSLSLGQYGQVANAFEKAANSGHPGAAVRLHWWYSGGSGMIAANPQTLQNYQTLPASSVTILKQKANFRGDNDPESQFTLAWCYQHGLGCEINLVKAAQYYWIAAAQGYRDAQYQLGVCCAAGIGVKADMSQAITYYEQAAKQGHIHAHYVLSQCYELGLGTQANPTKALGHKQAAQKGKHPQLVRIGLRPTTSVAISPNVPLEQEVKQLKQQLAQQTMTLNAKESELTQQAQVLQQQVQRVTELLKELQHTQQELKYAYLDSKERETNLKAEFGEYKKLPQSPPPPFPPTATVKPLSQAQQEQQNQLVAACLKGDLTLVKQLESQGTSFSHPNQEGLYPLVATAYGCSLETVRYVESKLKNEAEKQWNQVDVNKAKTLLDRWTPAELSKYATYGELGKWYVKYQGASWCAYYDTECLKRDGYKNWGGWDGNYKDVVWEIGGGHLWGESSARAIWHGEQDDKCIEETTPNEKDRPFWSTYYSYYPKRNIQSPSKKVHEDVVKIIREQLNTLRSEVESKVKRSSAAVFNPKV